MLVSFRNVCIVLLITTNCYFGLAQTNKQNNPSGNHTYRKSNNNPSIQQAASTAPIKCLNKKLSLAIHIVTDSLHHTIITQTQINTGLNKLNTDFSPICLNFFICKQDTIYNYEYYNFQNPKHLAQINQTYAVPNMINIYVVETLTPSLELGYADNTDNYMILTRAGISDGKTWSHEMGHFFSLWDTWGVQPPLTVTAELVNELHCATTGDSICDTPADIQIAVINACQWADVSKDANGNFYTPIIGNIMSSHPASCKTPFTVGQLNKMVNWYLTYRNYLR